MVEEIEELRPEVQSNPLGDQEALDQREIRVHEIRSRNRSTRSISESPNNPGVRTSRDQTTRVEPLAPVARPGIRVANLIRAVYGKEVVFEVDIRLVDTIHD